MSGVVVITCLGTVLWCIHKLDKKIKNHSKEYTTDETIAKTMLLNSSLKDHQLKFEGKIDSNTRGLDALCFLYSGKTENESISLVLVVKELNTEYNKLPKSLTVNSEILIRQYVQIKQYKKNNKVIFERFTYS